MNEKRGVELEVLLSVRMHSSIAEIISLTSKNKQVIGKSNQLNEFWNSNFLLPHGITRRVIYNYKGSTACVIAWLTGRDSWLTPFNLAHWIGYHNCLPSACYIEWPTVTSVRLKIWLLLYRGILIKFGISIFRSNSLFPLEDAQKSCEKSSSDKQVDWHLTCDAKQVAELPSYLIWRLRISYYWF